MLFPHFPYHPDPLTTGNIKASDEVCIVCHQARGYIYTGHTYAVEEYDGCICPWCIADGKAHEVLGATFTSIDDIGKTGADFACQDIKDEHAKDIPAAALEEVTYRTPGISTWQTAYWLTHCGDAAAFINAVGYHELKRMETAATAGIRDCLSWYEDRHWKRLLLVLDRVDWPTAYLFQCRHCGQYLGYVDWGGYTPPVCGWRLFDRLWRIPLLCRFIFQFRRSLRRFSKTDRMYSYPRKALRELEKRRQAETWGK